MIKSLFGSQEGVLSPIPPVPSAIPTPPSATPSPPQNPQTLQRFLSPLYVVVAPAYVELGKVVGSLQFVYKFMDEWEWGGIFDSDVV